MNDQGTASNAGAGWSETRARRMPSDELPVHDAVALTSGGSIALIALGAQTYTLRITRQGKLILTK